jgi:uncharacterized protein
VRAAPRECGSCSLCCRLLQIDAEHAPEAAHQAGDWCRFCTQPGCAIYDRRPTLCRDFKCQWLKDPRLGPEWYPPTSGMLLTFSADEKTLFVVCDPDRPNAHLVQPYRRDLERMAAWGRRAPAQPFEVKITGQADAQR